MQYLRMGFDQCQQVPRFAQKLPGLDAARAKRLTVAAMGLAIAVARLAAARAAWQAKRNAQLIRHAPRGARLASG